MPNAGVSEAQREKLPKENIPSFKEGQPRRSKNVTLPQRNRRGVGRSYNGFAQEKSTR